MSVQKWPQVMVFVANICCCYLKRKKEEKKLKKKIEKKIVTSFFIFSLITVLHPGQAVKILAHPVSKLNFELVLLRDKKSYPVGNPTLDPRTSSVHMNWLLYTSVPCDGSFNQS